MPVVRLITSAALPMIVIGALMHSASARLLLTIRKNIALNTPSSIAKMPHVRAATPTERVACSSSSSRSHAVVNLSTSLWPSVHFLNASLICLRSNTGECRRV